MDLLGTMTWSFSQNRRQNACPRRSPPVKIGGWMGESRPGAPERPLRPGGRRPVPRKKITVSKCRSEKKLSESLRPPPLFILILRDSAQRIFTLRHLRRITPREKREKWKLAAITAITTAITRRSHSCKPARLNGENDPDRYHSAITTGSIALNWSFWRRRRNACRYHYRFNRPNLVVLAQEVKMLSPSKTY